VQPVGRKGLEEIINEEATYSIRRTNSQRFLDKLTSLNFQAAIELKMMVP
jgi:hypothetical protein